MIAERAKEQQLSTLKQGNTVPQISAKREMPIETRQELAKVAGVSHDTIAKVERIEEEAPQPIVEASRRGDISVNSAYQVTKLAPEKQQEIAERIQNIHNEPEETKTPKAIQVQGVP